MKWRWTPRAFICYASDDRDWATEVAVAVEKEGYRAFIDYDRLPIGDRFHRQLRKELRSADVLVAVVGPGFGSKNYPKSEVRFAQRLGLKVVPLFVHIANAEDLPPPLRSSEAKRWPEKQLEILAELAAQRQVHRLLVLVTWGLGILAATSLFFAVQQVATGSELAVGPAELDPLTAGVADAEGANDHDMATGAIEGPTVGSSDGKDKNPASCRSDQKCIDGFRCQRPRRGTSRLGIVSKPLGQHSEGAQLAAECSNGRRVGAPKTRLIEGQGTCSARWASDDDRRCDVLFDIKGEFTERVRCEIFEQTGGGSSRLGRCVPR